MGASASAYCDISRPSVIDKISELAGTDESALVLRVAAVASVGGDTVGAKSVLPAVAAELTSSRTTGYEVGQELKIRELQTPSGLVALAARYREGYRENWPDAYRFQMSRRFWRVATPDGGTDNCVLSMATNPDERSIDNARQELADAEEAASYAHRFNIQLTKTHVDSSVRVYVAMPVICEVVQTGYPTVVPVGTIMTMYPYASEEVQKFVFSGKEEFVELPHAFFHYTAYSSGGKRFVCDVQGIEEDDGSLLLLDTTVLRAGKPTVAGLVSQALPIEGAASELTAKRFDTLHPVCGDTCRAFDPQRHTSKRFRGVCDIGATCGLGA